MATYDREVSCKDYDVNAVFQNIQQQIGVMIAADARDPLDHSDYIIPGATPMAPVASGADHDNGLWMPIRRTRIATVATDPVDETVVDDAEPFAIGDTVQAIDVAGPSTAVTDLGAITAIDYDTNTITTTNAANTLNVDDWIEVTENGACDGTSDWKRNRRVGMLLMPHDVRMVADDDGVVKTGTVVIEGAIRESDINFNADATNDVILMYEFGVFCGYPGIDIITPEHSDEIVALGDAP